MANDDDIDFWSFLSLSLTHRGGNKVDWGRIVTHISNVFYCRRRFFHASFLPRKISHFLYLSLSLSISHAFFFKSEININLIRLMLSVGVHVCCRYCFYPATCLTTVTLSVSCWMLYIVCDFLFFYTFYLIFLCVCVF
jgi:hypothetical protein